MGGTTLRYVIPILILALGIAWLSLGGPGVDGPGFLGSESEGDSAFPEDFTKHPDKYCEVLEPACQAAIQTAINEGRPTPLPDNPQLRTTFLADQTISALLSGLREGTDYVLNVGQWREREHGVAGGNAIVYFVRPVSFDATYPIAISPCAGQSSEGYVPPGTPCLKEPFRWDQRESSFEDIYTLQTSIDPDSGRVFNLRDARISSEKYCEVIKTMAIPEFCGLSD